MLSSAMGKSFLLSRLVLIIFAAHFAASKVVATRPGFSLHKNQRKMHSPIDVTLLESTGRNDDENAFAGLLKQASAALLNTYAGKGFPYSAWEVKTLFIQALVSKEAAATQAKQFSIANEACN
ncbi:hypothetical protein NC652_004932 [Populus alba x Populus x berolinensis]|nr:hypothetical protein NC652_004932 [Populus alba x Populus x berolinensis]